MHEKTVNTPKAFRKDKNMKFKRKNIGIELICISILSLLPLKGSSLQFVDSSDRKVVRNGIKRNERNEPTTLNIPGDETNEYYDLNHHSRSKRSNQGKLIYGMYY